MGQLKPGDRVHYCSIIGGEITSRNHIIKEICHAPNTFGIDVAKISNKAGIVALDSLVLADDHNEEN